MFSLFLIINYNLPILNSYLILIIVNNYYIKEIQMYRFDEVQKYLANLMTGSRVKKCYDLISKPKLRVNTEDKKWVNCLKDHELESITNDIMVILNFESEKQLIVEKKVKEVCKIFSNRNAVNKHRIPFYVLVINQLI